MNRPTEVTQGDMARFKQAFSNADTAGFENRAAAGLQAVLDARQPGKRTFLVAWQLGIAHRETGEQRQFTQTAFIELQPGEVFGPAKVSEVQKIVLQGMIERDPRLLQLRATAQVVSFQQLEDE